MFYRPKFLTVAFNYFLLLAALFNLVCQAALAAPDIENIVIARASAHHDADSSFSLLPKGKFYKHKPLDVAIYQYDDTALAKRTPLLIVHGLRAEYYPCFRWEKLIRRLNSNKEFASKFKIYLARYDSTAPLDKTVPQMQQKIAEFYQLVGSKQIVALALSMGGNVLYESMLDPQINDKIKLLMAMGTPFHGSPLFSADWLKYGIYKNLSFPWTRIDHSIAYKLYFSRNPNLLQDLRWDNCDGAIPNVGHFASRLPLGPKGNLIPARSVNPRMVAINQKNFDKNKLITYSGYQLNPYQLPETKRIIENTFLGPYTMFTIALPAYLAREHPVLKMLNRVISTVPTTESASKRAQTNFVYVLNDGITPVISSLFLADPRCATHGLSREVDLIKIRPYVDVHTARIFRNIDHLTYIDGSRPGVAPNTMRDELNPGAGNRDIFNWILFDLDCVTAEKETLQSKDT